MAENYHIAAVKGGLPDPQRTNLWLLEIGIPNGLDLSVPGQELPDTKKLQIRALGCSLPGRKFTTIETYFQNMTSTYVGREDMSGKTLDVTFYEYEDQYLTKALNVWLNNLNDTMDARSSKGGHGLAGQKYKNGTRGFEYSADIKIRLLGFNGEKLDKMFVLHNAWPESIGDVQMSYENANGITNRVTFRYDWMELANAT